MWFVADLNQAYLHFLLLIPYRYYYTFAFLCIIWAHKCRQAQLLAAPILQAPKFIF
jgi:hypothetical protein